jgi:excisionase family DNA binding protein
MLHRILLPRADAAFRLAISLRMLDELIAAKAIKAVKIGRRTLIPAVELEKFARRGTRQWQ